MYEIDWLEPDEWEACRKRMDSETFEEFRMYVKAEEPFSVGIPLPVIMIVDYCEKSRDKFAYKQARKEYEKLQDGDVHKELYRFLAYTIYGYGKWSNNDRRQKGISAIKMKRGKKR